MKFYMITGDADYMASTFSDDDQLSEIMMLAETGEKLDPDRCVKMKYYFDEPAAQGIVTDFPYPQIGGMLVLSQRAIEVLRPMLLTSGLLYKTQPDHPKGYQLFISYKTVDALDQNASVVNRLPSGAIWGVGKHVLRPEIVGDLDIFHIQDFRRRLYVSERFMRLVSQHRLTGLKVQPVWSDSHGPVTIDDPRRPFDRFPPGYGSTVQEKRQAMRDMIAGLR